MNTSPSQNDIPTTVAQDESDQALPIAVLPDEKVDLNKTSSDQESTSEREAREIGPTEEQKDGSIEEYGEQHIEEYGEQHIEEYGEQHIDAATIPDEGGDGDDGLRNNEEDAQDTGTSTAGVQQVSDQSEPAVLVETELDPEQPHFEIEGPDDDLSRTGSALDGEEGSNGARSDANYQLSPSSALHRDLSPASRTSTPPLAPGSTASAAKKFSSININKKFLNKAGSPAVPIASPGQPPKLTSLGSRPSASPVPIYSASSRLLNTKLTTVPSSNSTSAPANPPSGTLGSPQSPWAKPGVPSEPLPTPSPLRQPLALKPKTLVVTNVVIGSGQGLGSSAIRPAWRPVAAEGRRAGVGLARDFPTTKELAEGKKAAISAAQAQAAHNQAIIQGLNAFTHMDPNAHRWDDDDDEGEVLQFADGTTYNTTDYNRAPPPEPEPIHSEPVAKSERFSEDFDRSWPKRRPTAVEPPRPVQPDLARRESENRVLFNASSNRLEAPLIRQGPPPVPQPTQLMARPADLPKLQPAPEAKPLDRQLPPHLRSSVADDVGRMRPPHMAEASISVEAMNAPAASASGRLPWGTQKETSRSSLSLPNEPPTAISRQDAQVGGTIALPSLNQSQRLDIPIDPQRVDGRPEEASQSNAQPVSSDPIPVLSVPGILGAPKFDAQTAEMQSAADKARLRRLGEEQEREAAAERARRKARELEDRLGLKRPDELPTKDIILGPDITFAPTAPLPPTYIIATRPKPQSADLPTNLPTTMPATGLTGLPARPVTEIKIGETSWRSRTQPQEFAVNGTGPSKPTTAQAARPLAESFFEIPAEQSTADAGVEVSTVDGVSRPIRRLSGVEDGFKSGPSNPAQKHVAKKNSGFDDMLARIQAAMQEGKLLTPDVAEQAVVVSLPGQVAPVDIAAEGPPTPESMSQEIVNAADELTAVPSVQDFFDVTQPELPKSPRSAWRVFAIKIPKASAVRPQSIVPPHSIVPQSRSNPGGWLSTADIPNLDDGTSIASGSSLMGAFSGPSFTANVRLSSRTFERFARKNRRRPFEAPRPVEVVVPAASSDSLLPSDTASSFATAGSKPSSQLRQQRVPANGDRWKLDTSPLHDSIGAASQAADSASRKLRSLVKALPAAKPEKEGLLNSNGVGTHFPERARIALDPKPAVRFMVSSELEGDSLLDEVNKISLETIGEGEGKDEVNGVGSKTTGTETPKTPPTHSGASSRGLTSSPNGTSTPWSKSSARSSTQQHDHLKSMWDQTPAGPSESAKRSEPFASTSTMNPRSSEAATPMYPSLNAPSSADPPASLPLPSGVSMAYSNSQPFSSSSSSAVTSSLPYGARQSPAQYGFSSPEQNNTIGLNYAPVVSRSGMQQASGANGWPSMGQQGVWSPSAFGSSMTTPGYGYSAKPNQSAGMSIDAKTAMAFNSASGPYGVSAAGYGQQVASPFAQTYGQAQVANQSYQRGVGNTSNGQYGYTYGATGSAPQQVGRMPATSSNGRFAQANGDYANSMAYGSGMETGYYGGVGQDQQQQHQQQQHQQQQQQQAAQAAVYGAYPSHGAAGQQGRQTTAAGARKMW